MPLISGVVVRGRAVGRRFRASLYRSPSELPPNNRAAAVLT
jgi:hypothetical protein